MRAITILCLAKARALVALPAAAVRSALVSSESHTLPAAVRVAIEGARAAAPIAVSDLSAVGSLPNIVVALVLLIAVNQGLDDLRGLSAVTVVVDGDAELVC